MTMASYNEFQNNILRDTLIVTLGNCFSSVFAGFGVFSFLGHLAYRNIFSFDLSIIVDATYLTIRQMMEMSTEIAWMSMTWSKQVLVYHSSPIQKR